MKKQRKNKDWHHADIKCALAKKLGPDNKGYSFARIAREHGYVSNSPNTVLWTPWSTMERIVADLIGVTPQTIWPSRYDRHGNHLGTQIVNAKKKVGND